MNVYIKLDGKCYKTSNKTWRPPVDKKPMTVRVNSDGTLDATYAAAVTQLYEGEIMVSNTAPTSPTCSGGTWGVPADLETSLAKLQGLNFTDHEGTTYTGTAHVQLLGRRSLGPMWDAPSNTLFYHVRIIAK